jgi:hypothetical protein
VEINVPSEKQADCTADSHAGYHSDQRQQPHFSSLEVFLLRVNEMAADVDGDLFWLPPGWYWQFAEPGEAPDSNIYGPFATSIEAYDAAQVA